MAKKAAKKEAPAAKAKKAAKPVAKAAAKSTKTAKPAAKTPAKKAAKPVAKKATKPVKAAKPAKAPAKPVKAAKPTKAVAKKEPVVTKPVKAEKPAKEKKVAATEVAEKPRLKLVVDSVDEAPKKKEKKIKIDKTGLSEDQVKWHELHEKYKALKAPSYSISGQFEAKTPLMHKTFGWGFIVSNEYDRLEVLFEDGKRMLISNRQL